MANGIKPFGGRSPRAWANRRRRLVLDGGSVTDPYWDEVQLLLPFQSDNHDDSPQARGAPTAFIGSIDSYDAFGVGENMEGYNFANHSANDSYFWTDSANEMSIGSGDFTVEFYHKYGAAGNNTICAKGPASGEYEWAIDHQLNGAYRFYYSTNSTSWSTYNAVDFVSDTTDWRYISISRVGNNMYGHIDGTLITTTDVTGLDISGLGHEFQIGYATGMTSGAKDLANFRLTIGTGRYTTASYSPPTQPFTETYYDEDSA